MPDANRMADPAPRPVSSFIRTAVISETVSPLRRLPKFYEDLSQGPIYVFPITVLRSG